jgi:biotin transport system substrate-specific component
MSIEQIQRTVLASLMAALIALGAYLQVPIGAVPIVVQNLFVLLAGLLLGSRWALVSASLYLLAGAIGFPVFAGGKGGIGHLLGPTGGYLFGFVAAAWVTGLVAETRPDRRLVQVAAVSLGTLTIYVFGLPWLKLVSGMPWTRTLLLGMAPFLIGDVVKAALAVLLVRALRPMVERMPTQVLPS